MDGDIEHDAASTGRDRHHVGACAKGKGEPVLEHVQDSWREGGDIARDNDLELEGNDLDWETRRTSRTALHCFGARAEGRVLAAVAFAVTVHR